MIIVMTSLPEGGAPRSVLADDLALTVTVPTMDPVTAATQGGDMSLTMYTAAAVVTKAGRYTVKLKKNGAEVVAAAAIDGVAAVPIPTVAVTVEAAALSATKSTTNSGTVAAFSTASAVSVSTQATVPFTLKVSPRDEFGNLNPSGVVAGIALVGVTDTNVYCASADASVACAAPRTDARTDTTTCNTATCALVGPTVAQNTGIAESCGTVSYTFKLDKVIACASSAPRLR